MNYTVLVLYQTTSAWLELSRERRSLFFQAQVTPILDKYNDSLKIRLFDSEAFHPQTSDFMIVECDDLKKYYYFIEYLRDTELFSVPYLQLKDIVIGIENGSQKFEEMELNQRNSNPIGFTNSNKS